MKISEIKLQRFEAILTPLSSKNDSCSILCHLSLYLNSKLQLSFLLDNVVKMASKRHSFISLIIIINCITKCSLIRIID